MKTIFWLIFTCPSRKLLWTSHIANTDLIEQEVRPICLPDKPSSNVFEYDNDLAQLIGWGQASLNGKTPNSLKRVAIQIYSQRQVKLKLCLSYDKAFLQSLNVTLWYILGASDLCKDHVGSINWTTFRLGWQKGLH